jgi:hypothetical protein
MPKTMQYAPKIARETAYTMLYYTKKSIKLLVYKQYTILSIFINYSPKIV